jgi:hypothetical protein
MFCGQCGKNLPDDVRFCQSCGRPTAPAPIPTSFTNAAAAVAPALSSFAAPRTASHQQQVEHYSGSSDEEISRLASSVEDLTEDAKNALTEEKRRRGLFGSATVIEHRFVESVLTGILTDGLTVGVER